MGNAEGNVDKVDVDQVEVMDLYLACYYVMRGCELAAVKCIPTGRDLRCSVVVKGAFDLVHEIQDEYFSHRANVNLWDFRDAYNQVNGCIRQAKKSYGHEDRRGGEVAGGGA